MAGAISRGRRQAVLFLPDKSMKALAAYLIMCINLAGSNAEEANFLASRDSQGLNLAQLQTKSEACFPSILLPWFLGSQRQKLSSC